MADLSTSPDMQILSKPGKPVAKPVVTPNQLGGPSKCLQFCIPPGIGDFLFQASKMRGIKEVTGKEIILYTPGHEAQMRANDILPLFPEFHYGGNLLDRTSADVVNSCIPSHWGMDGNYNLTGIHNLAANRHLETGQSIEAWLPQLPMDYHIKPNIPQECVDQARQIADELNEKIVICYLHNRWKDQHMPNDWAMWSDEEWIDTLTKVEQLDNFKGCSFVFIGCSWDQDKTQDVQEALANKGYSTKLLINYPLGTIFELMKLSYYMISYPSGMGIAADVFELPTLMWLPSHLWGLENSYADPKNIASGKYKAKVRISPDEAIEWIKNNPYLNKSSDD